MNRYGIGQGNFIDFLPFVLDVLLRIAHVHDVVLHGKNLADIAVKYALVIVVLLLHDLIACTEGHLSRLMLAFAFLGPVDGGLYDGV